MKQAKNGYETPQEFQLIMKATHIIITEYGKGCLSPFHKRNFVSFVSKSETSRDRRGFVHNGRFLADFGQIL